MLCDLDRYKDIDALKHILAVKCNAVQYFSKVSSFVVWDMKLTTQNRDFCRGAETTRHTNGMAQSLI